MIEIRTRKKKFHYENYKLYHRGEMIGFLRNGQKSFDDHYGGSFENWIEHLYKRDTKRLKTINNAEERDLLIYRWRKYDR